MQLIRTDRYCFGSLNRNDQKFVWDKAMSVFVDALGFSAENIGYRAGGWSLSPFNEFQQYFEMYSIQYEFSILPGHKSQTTAQKYDFSHVQEREPFSLTKENSFTKEIYNLDMFPISCIEYQRGLKEKMLDSILWRTGDQGIGDGQSVNPKNLEEDIRSGEMVSIDLLDYFAIKEYKQFLKLNDYMQFISHPKMLRSHSQNMLDKFLNEANKNYMVNYDFQKINIK